jgi:hypothetical protein
MINRPHWRRGARTDVIRSCSTLTLKVRRTLGKLVQEKMKRPIAPQPHSAPRRRQPSDPAIFALTFVPGLARQARSSQEKEDL